MSSSYLNLNFIDNLLSEGNLSIHDIGDKVPIIFSRGRTNFTIEYLNPKGQEHLNFTLGNSQSQNYHFFNSCLHPDSLDEILERISKFYSLSDQSQIHSELGKVWFSKKQEYRLCLINVKRCQTFNGILATIQPLEEVSFLPRLARRIRDEQQFMNKNSDSFQLLTLREKQIISLLASGLNNPQISTQLHISRHTVEQHRKNINRKLHTKSFAQLLKYAQAFDLA